MAGAEKHIDLKHVVRPGSRLVHRWDDRAVRAKRLKRGAARVPQHQLAVEHRGSSRHHRQHNSVQRAEARFWAVVVAGTAVVVDAVAVFVDLPGRRGGM
uniref:Uncharacterized protein n=1 Tax=Chlamydomonas euryale TaxID=1486919 RepID=A0A7R9YVX7_9CHLO